MRTYLLIFPLILISCEKAPTAVLPGSLAIPDRLNELITNPAPYSKSHQPSSSTEGESFFIQDERLGSVTVRIAVTRDPSSSQQEMRTLEINEPCNIKPANPKEREDLVGGSIAPIDAPNWTLASGAWKIQSGPIKDGYLLEYPTCPSIAMWPYKSK